MTEGLALDLCRQLLLLAVELAGPVIFGGLVLGIMVGILQSATQIQEQTLTFLPKLALAVTTVLVGGPWALERMIHFAVEMFHTLADLGAAGLA